MLILTRHLEEAVRIGAGVVRVVGITVKHAPDCRCHCPTREPRRVALGFEFPDDVNIVREELLERRPR